jgi:hypothetical protein
MTKNMIVEMTAQEALYVSLNLRDVDYRELTANRWIEGKSKREICEEIGIEASRFPGIAWTCYLKDEPVAIGGIAYHHPKVGAAWLFGTDKLRKRAWGEITRHSRKLMQNILEVCDIHRVEALSIEFHKESHFWLEKIGMKKESILLKRGQNGENFYMFTLIKE